MNFQIRKMNHEDLAEVSQQIGLFDEFWNKNILESEFKNDQTEYYVIIDYSKVVAFAGILVGVDSCEIMNIAVNKDFRRTGYGSKMLKYLIKRTKELGKEELLLEVNEKNTPAIELYKKFGFTIDGYRKNYYNGKEDAILMNLQL